MGEEPGGLQSMGSLRVRHNWATSLSLFTFMHWRGNGNPLQYTCLENPMGEEPGGLQSMGSLRVRHNWATSLSLFTFMHWRRKWQPTPVFLPGESQGWRSLVGCRLWVTQSRTRLKRLSSSSRTTTRVFAICLWCCRCWPLTPPEWNSEWRVRHSVLQGNWWNRSLNS